jgi:hypothetical protein
MPWQPTTVSDEEQVVLHSVSPMTWKTRKRAAGPVRRTHLVAVPPTCSWKAAQCWHPIPWSSLCRTLVCSRQTLQRTRISGSSEQSQFPNSHTCLQRNTEGIAWGFRRAGFEPALKEMMLGLFIWISPLQCIPSLDELSENETNFLKRTLLFNFFFTWF